MHGLPMGLPVEALAIDKSSASTKRIAFEGSKAITCSIDANLIASEGLTALYDEFCQVKARMHIAVQQSKEGTQELSCAKSNAHPPI